MEHAGRGRPAWRHGRYLATLSDRYCRSRWCVDADADTDGLALCRPHPGNGARCRRRIHCHLGPPQTRRLVAPARRLDAHLLKPVKQDELLGDDLPGYELGPG